MAALAEIDAVTVDAYGTLLELRDPVGALARRLPGVGRDAVERAFRAEVRHYLAHSVEGRDAQRLVALYESCTAVFNDELGTSLAPQELVAALDEEYRLLPGAVEALDRLRALGLELAVVGNWDCRLGEQLERLGVRGRVSAVVSSAVAGAAKPDPHPFLAALGRLGVEPGRALHVGDQPADEEGARAAGLRFEPAPLATVPERLG